MMRRFVHLLENSNKRVFNNNWTSFMSQYALATTKSVKVTGVCKWWDHKKGFGFITLDDGSDDVFVHQTNIQTDGFRSLGEGEALEFTVELVDGRKTALNVTGPNGVQVKGVTREQRDRRGKFGREKYGGRDGENDRRPRSRDNSIKNRREKEHEK